MKQVFKQNCKNKQSMLRDLTGLSLESDSLGCGPVRSRWNMSNFPATLSIMLSASCGCDCAGGCACCCLDIACKPAQDKTMVLFDAAQ